MIGKNSTRPETTVAETFIDEGDAFVRAARHDEALKCYERVVGQLGDADDREGRRLVGRALSKRASVLVSLSRETEADAAYEALSAWLSGSSSVNVAVAPRVALIRAQALSDAGRYAQAVIAANESLALLDRDPSDQPELWVSALNIKANALAGAGQLDKANGLLQELIERYDRVPSVQRGVVRAWMKKASLLDDLDEYERATNIYDKLASRFGDADEDELREVVADALSAKACLLRERGKYIESLSAETEIVKRFDGKPPRQRPYTALHALISRAWLEGELHRTADAIATYDDIVRQYGDVRELAVRAKVAGALASKACVLLDDAREKEAIDVVDELDARFGDENSPQLAVQVLRGLIRKGLALGRLGRHQECIELVDQAVDRFGGAAEPDLHEAVGELIGLKALALRRLGDLEQSADVFGQVAECYGGETSPAMRTLVRHALTQRVEVLAAAGRSAEAIVLSGSLLKSGDDADPSERSLSDVLSAKGMALLAEERYEEAIEVLDEVATRYGDATEPALRRQVALALVNKVVALAHLDRDGASEAVFEDIVARYGEEALTMFDNAAAYFANIEDPQAAEGIASALYGKAVAFGKLGRKREAVATLAELVARFQGDDSESVQMIVLDARAARAEMLDGDEP